MDSVWMKGRKAVEKGKVVVVMIVWKKMMPRRDLPFSFPGFDSDDE